MIWEGTTETGDYLMRSPWLFQLFLAIASDLFAAVICFVVFWVHGRGRDPVVRNISLVMFGVIIRSVSEIMANGFGFVVRPSYTAGYAWMYWIGRAVFTLTLWWTAIGLLKWKDRIKNGNSHGASAGK